MSLRELVEADCGGQNPLMRLGTQLTRDVTFQDQGLGAHAMNPNMQQQQQQGMPQTFRLAEIMNEIHQIEQQSMHPAAMGRSHPTGKEWMDEFMLENPSTSGAPIAMQSQVMGPPSMMGIRPSYTAMSGLPQQHHGTQMELAKVGWTKDFFDAEDKVQADDIDEWVKAFEHGKEAEEQAAGLYNQEFFKKLQDEWKRVSEESSAEGHSWLGDFSDIYDPFKEYKFEEQNPMIDAENPLEKGKAFLTQGDIPSAVLCFEAAVKQNTDSAEAWKLLGTTQAENENDPNAIPALKRALELSPGTLDILMSLAVCYTNESYQNQALKMLTTWLSSHPQYGHLVPPTNPEGGEENSTVAPRYKVKEVQDLFLDVVARNPTVVDPDVQEALGVLFNLSQEFDKAVDCFRASVAVRPDNAKSWNRLGASLANGNRNIEAVEAYQNALQLEPGFIRARYNVGIICINLKSYKEAAEHLLMALNHQAASTSRAGIHSKKPMSDSIWNTLKMAISLDGKYHLNKEIENRNLDALNAAFAGN